MSATGWGEGYATEQVYTAHYYPEQAPEHLNFVCLLNGVEPVPLDRPYTYCELGCGHGQTVTLLAAANPDGRFYGIDFMPAHVAGARQLAREARLENLTFLEDSFADLAAGRGGLPTFDFITLHGVYSWVSQENRRHIVDFISRHLKPGGLVYVSYNALPGWARAMPMRRLLASEAALHPGEGPQRIASAQTALDELLQAQAGYFRDHADLPAQFDVFDRSEAGRTYLVHEYLNRVAEPMYHADVAADFAPAKLDYVGQGTLSVSFQSFPEVQQRLLDTIGDPAWRETVKDFIVNTRFRMDIFVRGRRPMPDAVRLDRLQRCALNMTVPRGEASLGIVGLPRAAQDDPQDAVLDALGREPLSFADLARFPLFGDDVELVAQVSALMSGLKHASVSVSDRREVDPAAAWRLNQVMAVQARYQKGRAALTSPSTGQGIRASRLECLVHGAVAGGRPEDIADPRTVASAVWPFLSDGHEGAPSARHEVEVAHVLASCMPLWHRLRML